MPSVTTMISSISDLVSSWLVTATYMAPCVLACANESISVNCVPAGLANIILYAFTVVEPPDVDDACNVVVVLE